MGEGPLSSSGSFQFIFTVVLFIPSTRGALSFLGAVHKKKNYLDIIVHNTWEIIYCTDIRRSLIRKKTKTKQHS